MLSDIYRIRYRIRHRSIVRLLMPLTVLTVFSLAVNPAPLGPTLVEPLEDRFASPAALPARIDGIIAVGGGYDRMMEAVRLAKMFPLAHLLFTGDGEERWLDYAQAAGIDPNRLTVEPLSGTTYENAQFSSAMVRPNPSQTWLLVTSAAHMPRTVGTFRKAGFSVKPWPVRRTEVSAADAYAVARHEWLGLVAYWLLGRTDTLFPGPRPDPSSSSAQMTHDLAGAARNAS